MFGRFTATKRIAEAEAAATLAAMPAEPPPLMDATGIDLAEEVAKLEPLAAPGRPFRLSVLELQAMVAGRKGDSKRARDLWTEIARDPEVPQGLAQRAASMVNLYGPAEAK